MKPTPRWLPPPSPALRQSGRDFRPPSRLPPPQALPLAPSAPAAAPPSPLSDPAPNRLPEWWTEREQWECGQYDLESMHTAAHVALELVRLWTCMKVGQVARPKRGPASGTVLAHVATVLVGRGSQALLCAILGSLVAGARKCRGLLADLRHVSYMWVMRRRLCACGRSEVGSWSDALWQLGLGPVGTRVLCAAHVRKNRSSLAQSAL